ncbi:unnamed protein product [Durusdinium trenchii]|uniref:PDZ domain-containing protein n=1 Tax=Durusdinium trenchii TaxID=1381693 RepID=A0ABP0MPV7_9DINO
MLCCCGASELPHGPDEQLIPVQSAHGPRLSEVRTGTEGCWSFTVELRRHYDMDFGLDLSAAGKVCMVNAVHVGRAGLVDLWNQSVSQKGMKEHEILPFDRLMSVNDETPSNGKVVVERLREATGAVTLVVQRPMLRKVSVRGPSWKSLGISVQLLKPCLLITHIHEGVFLDHNSSALPEEVIRVPCRIFSVNGQRGSGSELQKAMQEASNHLDLEILHYD